MVASLLRTIWVSCLSLRASFAFKPGSEAHLVDAVNAWKIDATTARNTYGEMNAWNVESIVFMGELFKNWDFNEPISNWNTGRVTTMASMFESASNFNQPIGDWNIGSVHNLEKMFRFTSAFNQPVGAWNTGVVTTMSSMFQSAGPFNQPLAGWNTGSVITMDSMFRVWPNTLAFNQPIGDWNTGSVTSMDLMFMVTPNIPFITAPFNHAIGQWNTGRVASMDYMFGYAHFNQPVGGWNTGSVTMMRLMFFGNEFFNQYIGDWNTGSVTDMYGMFQSASSFNQPIGGWNIRNVINMNSMFMNAGDFCQSINPWRSNALVFESVYGSIPANVLVCQECGKHFLNCFACDERGCLQCENSSYLLLDHHIESLSSRDGVELPGHCNSGACCTQTCPPLFFGRGTGRMGRTCKECESSCISCHNASMCNECTDGKYLHDSKCFYFCPDGTFANGSDMTGRRCLACGHRCSSCLNNAICHVCTDEAYLYDAICVDVCPSGTAPYGAARTGRTCENCEEFCASCSDTSTCTKCASMYYLNNGNCIELCPSGTFANETLFFCGVCPDHCSVCVDTATCSECGNFKYLHDNRCFDECPPATAPDGLGTTGRYCAPCEDNCAACSDGSSCTMCTNNNYLHNSDCVLTCPQGSFATISNEAGLFCAPCEVPFCLLCLDAQTCKFCEDRYMYNGDCMTSCPSGTFATATDSGSFCHDCGLHCSSCTNASTCVLCSDGMYLFENSCWERCPLGTSEVGIGSAGRICQPCEALDCDVCRDVSTCTACKNSKYQYQGQCFSGCPNRTVQLGLGVYQCASCENSNCWICSSAAVCNTCANSTYLHKDDCVKECPSGTFQDGEEDIGRMCQSCQTDCSLCSTPNACFGCMNGKYLYEEACLDTCPPGSVAVGSGMVGLTCEDPDTCSFLFTASLETGSCEPNWPVWSGLLLGASLCFLALLVQFLQHKSRKALLRAIETNKEERIRAALQRAKTFKISHSNQIVKAAKRQLKVLRGKYTDYEALLQILDRGVEFGDMKLLRGSWLMDVRNLRRMRRQQELPKEAFWPPTELRSQLTVASIVAISYCWLHPVNPDPCSKHLKELQRAIKLRLELKGPGQIQDLAVFLDFASLPQHGEQGDERDPVRGTKRSEDEEAAFINGLKNVNIPYASQLTETWMMKWVPDEEPRKYMMRGWPFFEQAVSSLIKPTTMLIEINAEVLTAESWIDVHEKGKCGRKPPHIPSKFKDDLALKTFTNGKTDQEFVEGKYAETFKDVVGTATALWFAGVGWTDDDAEVIVEMFPFATSLERLLLSDNYFSRIGAEVLVQEGVRCPSLQYLDLSHNRICEGDMKGLQQIWDSAHKPSQGLHIAAAEQHSRREQETLGTQETHVEDAEPIEQRTAKVIGNVDKDSTMERLVDL